MSDSSANDCPSLHELDDFVARAEPESAVAAHVDGCADCQSRIAEIQANNELMSSILKSGVRRRIKTNESESPGADTIEGYEILGELHRGGQGIVYRARQTATNRVVALKVLLAGAFATSRQRRRFDREIEIVAQLDHPNIVTVYDSGVSADGRHYFAMQYVEGVPLDDWLRRRQRPHGGESAITLKEMLARFALVCDAVGYAHQHGVIHRDLKPENILVDDEGRPHVLDFGLAKPIDAAADPAAAKVTREGAFVGTLSYAAPEQTRADPSLVDVRTDVYSLGVVLYEILTGRFPYPVDGDLARVLDTIATVEPDSPSAALRACGAVAPDLSPFALDHELDTIVLKALAKDKDRRYQSAAALRDDIRRYLSGAPIDAKRDSGFYVLKKTLARYRWRVSIAATFVLLLIAFGASMAIMYQRASTEANKVRQINIFLEDTLGSAEQAHEGAEVSVRDLLDEAVQWIDMALADQPEVAASIQATIGNSYRNLGLLDRAEPLLQASLETRRRLFGEEHLDVAWSLNLLALLRHDQGRFDEADKMYQKAMLMRRRLSGSDRGNIYTLANLARLRNDQGRFDEAEQLLTESLEIRRQIFGDNSADVAMCLFSLAETALQRGDMGRALELHRRALEMRRAVLHRHHPDLRRSLDALAHLLGETGNAAESAALLAERGAIQAEIDGNAEQTAP